MDLSAPRYLTSELDVVQCLYLLQQQVCNLNLFMSLVPSTIGPRVSFVLITSNLPDLTVTCRFYLHSSLLFPASMMPVLFTQLSHTLWCPYGQGRPSLDTCFVMFLYLGSVLMAATCALAHFSLHIDASKISFRPLHLNVKVKVVSLMHQPPLPPGNTPGTHFCQRLSQPAGPQCDQKDYVTEKF